jgi:hypothetical protein
MQCILSVLQRYNFVAVASINYLVTYLLISMDHLEARNKRLLRGVELSDNSNHKTGNMNNTSLLGRAYANSDCH